MYPNNPALGSPFGTGNETFGFGSQYKRVAAMAVDIWFVGSRRAFAHAASASGVDVFCYLFNDPQAVTPGYGGVCYSIRPPLRGELTSCRSCPWQSNTVHVWCDVPGWKPSACREPERNYARLLDLLRGFTGHKRWKG